MKSDNQADEKRPVENTEGPVKKPKEPINWKKEILSWIILIAVAFVVAKLITTFIIIKAEIPSGSMVETIHKGDKIVGNRLAYLFSEPERGDIMIFELPDDPSQTYIKRLIGLPGETVTIKEGKVYINDSSEPLVENYLHEEMIGNYGPYEVPEGCYFMLGDNRNSSIDARSWTIKFVTEDQIIAKAWFRYSPSLDWLNGDAYSEE